MQGAKRAGLMLLFLLATSMVVNAVPAKPGLRRQLTLTDGTKVNALLVGDEYGHYWLGENGNTYQAVFDTDVYQQIDAQNVRQHAQARRNAANQRRVRRLAPQRVGEVGGIIGDKKGIIILVNFKDKSFSATQSDFNKLANQVNYNSGNYKGSMYDYFYAQSDGQFRLTFDVVGPYTLSQKCSYYGGNDSNGDDLRPGNMVKEAVQLANSDVNFADYDWDNDGYVDQVYVVYAGKGEADGGSNDTIWPHEWDLSSATGSYITLDGKIINTYACGGEQNGGTGATAGIGTMCHEFSHCLGYPDFYDTDYSGGQGMFEWDLMDSGSYNGDGYRPAGYTSYERWVAGWKTPVELTATQAVSNMKPLQTTGSDTYIIYNKGNRDEYYLLENRQKIGWDTDIPGAGLLILHVDYNASAWSNNTPNDTPSHQRMTWIAADNQYQYTTYQGTKYYTTEGAANDPFPYGSVNAFGKNTTPAAKLFNANLDGTYYLDSSVENITQNSDKTVSFNFVGISNVATPTFSPDAGRYENAQTVTIACETSGATIYYTTDGTTPSNSSTVYSSPLTISETTTVKAVAYKNDEQSAVATAKYRIGASASDPNTTTFRLVTSTDDIEPGLRYVIACGSKNMAAGAMGNGTYLSNVQVNVSDDVITITDNVAVFVLEEGGEGWTFQNETTGQYLVSTAAKNVGYDSDGYEWTLSNGTNGVIMTAGNFGTILYNNTSPRFTTYTSNPTASMIQANLYVEDSNSTPVVPDPLIVADETVTFNTVVDLPQTKTFEVMSEGLTEDITVTLTDANNVFSLESNTISRTESELGATGSVTFTPTLAGTYTGTITLTSAGADPVTISLSATAIEVGGSTPDAETIFYEGLSEYDLNSDGNQELTSSSEYLDYNGWDNLTKVYAGSNSIAYRNGGCLKLGSSNGIGRMTTGEIQLTGDATLTFYLKQYNRDTGKLNVTVTGADADVAQFTPSEAWTLCTVNLTDAEGAVTLSFATSSKRAYIDEIQLTTGSTTPVEKDNVTMEFSPDEVEATIGDDFTEPTLTTYPEGLEVTYSSSDNSVATVDEHTGEVTLVAEGTVTITATFAGDDDYNEGSASYTLTVSEPIIVGAAKYALVTNANTLADGDNILIAYVNGDDVLVMGTTQNANNRAATTSVTLNDDDTLSPGVNAQIITLEKDGDNFLFNVGNGYLYAASNSKNYLKTETEADENAQAAISISSDGNATITFQGENQRNTIRYNPNSGSPIFSCYKSNATTGSAPQIYKKIPSYVPTIVLEDAIDNASTISDYADQMVNAVLGGRTLYKDCGWNTLCLPFKLTSFFGTPLEGATVKELTTASYDASTSTLNLNFSEVDAIEVGKPYIVKWETTGTDIFSPTFENVTIKNVDMTDKVIDNVLTFKGSFAPVMFEDDDRSILFMGGESTLYYPAHDAYINAFRCYFELSGNLHASDPSDPTAGIKNFTLTFDDETTGVQGIINDGRISVLADDGWYDLSGRRLNGMPTVPGIYINNGKKVIIK